MKRGFFALRVAAVVEETRETKSYSLEVPEELREAFSWRPGQHLTVLLALDGEPVRRTYTISSSPDTGEPLRITVKRIEGGRVSNALHQRIEVGSTLDVSPPFGSFCLDPRATAHRTHYFFAAGSGITPVYAMLRSVLAAEPYSRIHLLYGNRRARDIIFLEALRELQRDHAERFTLTHCLSKPSIWSSFDAWSGRIDAAAVRRFLGANPPYAQDAQYYLCGPGRMNHDLRQALMQLDVPGERIHREHFGGAHESDEVEVEGCAASLRARIGGRDHTLQVRPGDTLLRTLLDADLPARFSCEAGLCGSCRARLVAGSVHMRQSLALADDEIRGGWILCCQALPAEPLLTVHFEE